MDVRSGHGYQGVVLYDDVSDRVQCHVCGKFYQNVGSHANKKHQMSADDYKIKFGLTLRTALCSVGLSSRRREATNAAIERGEIRQDIATQSARHNKNRKRSYRQVGVQTVQFFNRNGLCDLQIKTRYEVVEKMVGRVPTQNEIIKYDRKLFFCGIVPRYGNLNKFREEIGGSYNHDPSNKISDTTLVAMLRKKSLEVGRRPKVTDFSGRHKAFYRVFGSWSGALRFAGLK